MGATQYTFSAQQQLMSNAATSTNVDRAIVCWNDCRKGSSEVRIYTHVDFEDENFVAQFLFFLFNKNTFMRKRKKGMHPSEFLFLVSSGKR